MIKVLVLLVIALHLIISGVTTVLQKGGRQSNVFMNFIFAGIFVAIALTI